MIENKPSCYYGYVVKYMNTNGQILEETMKGFDTQEYAELNLSRLLNDLKAENEIIDARIHNYYHLPSMVCVIGSSRFKDIIRSVQDNYTYKGYIVLDNAYPTDRLAKLPKEVTKEHIFRLKSLGAFKVRISDLIYVVNQDGYIGEDTAEKLLLAKTLNKDILYLEKIDE